MRPPGLLAERGERVDNRREDHAPSLASAYAPLVADRIVTVLVKPGSRKGPLVESGPDGILVIRVREPAIDGRATKAAGEALAKHLGVPRNRVTLTAGATSRHKRFRVTD
jgi:uncharacterized protein YggU (UPF0235/DUF167 family)